MNEDKTQLDTAGTLERIRQTVESIRDRVTNSNQADIGSILKDFTASIDSKLSAVLPGKNVPSPAATDAGTTGTETPLAQIANIVAQIKTRLDSLASLDSKNAPPGIPDANTERSDARGKSSDSAKVDDKQNALMSLISRNVEQIKLRLTGQVKPTGMAAKEETVPAVQREKTSKEPQGFKDYIGGLWKSIKTNVAAAWMGPQQTNQTTQQTVTGQTNQTTQTATNVTNNTANQQSTVVQNPPSILRGMGNLLSAGMSKLVGPSPDFKDRLSGAYEKTKDAVKDTNPLTSFGSMIGGVGKLAGAMPVVGGPIAGVAKLGEVAFKSVDKLQQWTESLHQANMQFAEFSGAMASVQAKQTVRDIGYSQRRGSARAESADYLAEGMSDLRDAVAPVGDLVADVKNYVGGFLSKSLTGILGGIFKLIGLTEKQPTGKDSEGKPLFKEAGEIGEEYWKQKGSPGFK